MPDSIIVRAFASRNCISHILCLLGGLVAATVCYIYPWYGLLLEKPRSTEIVITWLMVPMGFIIALAIPLLVLSQIVKSRIGEELGRISDIKEFSVCDDAITRLCKFGYLFLGFAQIFLGGYFAVSINIVVLFYFMSSRQ